MQHLSDPKYMPSAYSWQVRALEAERLLAEARKVLKPFAKRAASALGPSYMSSVKDEWLLAARSFLARTGEAD